MAKAQDKTPKEKVVAKASALSMDEEIHKGLTPKLDQVKNDYADHPKLAKFKPQGANNNDK